MPIVRFIEHTGTERSVEVPVGFSVMEGGVKNSVPGLIAECGGACACATCHVYVKGDWLERLPAMSATEQGMLEFVVDRRPNSRLSCQIKVTEALDGLVVETPENQL